MKKYITFIGDVHGCFRSLKALLKKIPPEDNRIVLLGDIINKGKRSFEAYQYVRQKGLETLLGNHDFYCIHRNKKDYKDSWLKLGGIETIQSIKNSQQLTSESHVQIMLAEMAYYFEQVPLFVKAETNWGVTLLATHGGISSKVYRQCNSNVSACLKIDVAQPASFLFNKGDLAEISGTIQVIGHQPTEFNHIRSGSNYRLDTGCVYNRKGMGWLTALQFNLQQAEQPRFYHQVNID